jgi:hypothetical protein
MSDRHEEHRCYQFTVERDEARQAIVQIHCETDAKIYHLRFKAKWKDDLGRKTLRLELQLRQSVDKGCIGLDST